MAFRVDTHIHIVPPSFRKVLLEHGDPSGWFIPETSAPTAIAFMDKIRVKTAVFSITSPGPALLTDPKAALELAKQSNNEVSEMCASQPDRFRYWASLPAFTNVEDTLEAIKHAATLPVKPEGFVIMTTYNDRLIGDPAFDKIWQEFDRQHAIIFVHPSSVNIQPHLIAGFLAQPALDYPHQSSRAAIDLLLHGHLQRFENIKIVLSHAGGSLPFLAERVRSCISIPQLAKHLPEGVNYESFPTDIKKFYFDLAMATTKIDLYALAQITTPDRVLFGSDWPYANPPQIEDWVKLLDGNTEEGSQFADFFRASGADNAQTLFGW